ADADVGRAALDVAAVAHRAGLDVAGAGPDIQAAHDVELDVAGARRDAGVAQLAVGLDVGRGALQLGATAGRHRDGGPDLAAAAEQSALALRHLDDDVVAALLDPGVVDQLLGCRVAGERLELDGG